MPSTIADVAQEKGALLQRRGVEWNYSVTDHDWAFSDAHGTLENLPLPLVPQPNAATALAALRASGLEVSENAIRDGIASAILPGRFQIVSESPRVIFDVAHNPHAAEYLTGRMKALPKNGHVLAVIGMLHDIARHWKGRAVPRQNNCLSIWVTANHLIALRRHGMPQWRTLKRKTPCWCVVLSTLSHMSWK